MSQPILILMGPTASGKSAMGLTIAKRSGGAILNADAMQSYADLHVITARPAETEMQGITHQLYGMWDARVMGNAALWQTQAVAAIKACHKCAKLPILLGGTGMYLKGLSEGLSPVPPISDAVRARVYAFEEPYRALEQYDRAMAAQLKPGDSQRICRALEVVLETGRSLLDWQAEQTAAPFSPHQCHTAYIDIDRALLYERINQRFDVMMQQGALDEVRALMEKFSAQELADKRYPILKAHGVPELMAHVNGQMSLDEAIDKAKQHTRNYAKRQMTWIRRQLHDAQALPFEADAETLQRWLETALSR